MHIVERAGVGNEASVRAKSVEDGETLGLGPGPQCWVHGPRRMETKHHRVECRASSPSISALSSYIPAILFPNTTSLLSPSASTRVAYCPPTTLIPTRTTPPPSPVAISISNDEHDAGGIGNESYNVGIGSGKVVVEVVVERRRTSHNARGNFRSGKSVAHAHVPCAGRYGADVLADVNDVEADDVETSREERKVMSRNRSALKDAVPVQFFIPALWRGGFGGRMHTVNLRLHQAQLLHPCLDPDNSDRLLAQANAFFVKGVEDAECAASFSGRLEA
ncbi:hypothetical protein K439DRAFT_1663793 [Ramaria rubella]|nr:hypothetical protein K439DRAFT_1663793 [Ramaria rubella]